MIKILKPLGILLTNFIICVAAGHGAGPLLLLEIFFFEELLSFNKNTESFYTTFPKFSFANPYEDMILYFILFSALGQIFFLISYFKFFRERVKRITRFLGILLMLFGFFLITKNLFHDGLAIFSFVTGIPFLWLVFFEVNSISNE